MRFKLQRFDPILETNFREYAKRRTIFSLRFTAVISTLYTIALAYRDFNITNNEQVIYMRALQCIAILFFSSFTFHNKLKNYSNVLGIAALFCFYFIQLWMHYMDIVPAMELGNSVPILLFASSLGLGLPFYQSLSSSTVLVTLMIASAYILKDQGFIPKMENIILYFGIATGMGFLYEREIRISFYRLTKVQRLNKKLENSNKMRLNLLSIISHEINGPLSNLSSTIELKESKNLSDTEFKGLIHEINVQVGSISQLLYGMTNWAKSQIDGFQPNRKKTTLKEVFEVVENGINHLSKDKNITVKYELDRDKELTVDRNMLSIIIRNILVNGIKFSESGSSILVKESSNRDKLRIDITDYGKGMTKEKCQTLFNYDVTSEDGTFNELGTGLGLHISKQLAVQLNAEVLVHSEINVGTTFRIILPI